MGDVSLGPARQGKPVAGANSFLNWRFAGRRFSSRKRTKKDKNKKTRDGGPDSSNDMVADPRAEEGGCRCGS